MAAAALLVYGALSLLALAAYVNVAAQIWTWKSLLVLVCSIVAGVCGALVLVRGATQSNLAAGLTVMLLGALRVGDPYDWNWASWVILISTLVLAAPVARAVWVIHEIDRLSG